MQQPKDRAVEEDYTTEIIEKTMKIGLDAKNQLFVRIPQEIAQFLRISKGDNFKFKIKSQVNNKKPELSFKIMKGKHK